MSNNGNENSAFKQLIVGAFAIVAAWIWWVDKGLSGLIQWMDSHKEYHQLEEKNCAEFRKSQNDKIENLEEECAKVEKRLNKRIDEND